MGVTVVVITVIYSLTHDIRSLVEVIVLFLATKYGYVHIRVLIGFEYETGGTAMGL